MESNKIVIYQIFTRLYGNRNTTRKEHGTIEENGCGKLNDFTPSALKKIREMGVSHIWYTGIIRHATQTDYSAYGIPKNHPAIVKGRAGSPYAITDYYDVDPDLATDVDKRMQEFEQLVERTHKAGMKVIIDFVPNHVARQYHSICKPEWVKDLGEDDNVQNGFDPQNNFYYCPGQRFSPYFDLYHGSEEPYLEEPAKATGNDCFHNAPGMNDWYETVKLNYGVDYYAGGVGHFDPIPDTWAKMTDILFFWASKGIDGFRCDMAEMVPAAFWQWFLLLSGTGLLTRLSSAIPTSCSSERSIILPNIAITWVQASTTSTIRWACTTPFAMSSVAISPRMPSRLPGSRPTTSATICSTSSRTTTSSASPVTFSQPMPARACPVL